MGTANLGTAALIESGLVDRETVAGVQEANPGSYIAGNVLGLGALALGSGGTGAAARGARLLTAPTRAVMGLGRAAEVGGTALLGEGTAARIATAGLQSAVEGSLFGVGQAVSDASIHDVPLTAERIVAAAGHGALLGGGLGVGTSVLGAVARGGATKVNSLLGHVEASEARLAGELGAAVPQTEAAAQSLAGRAEREFTLKAYGFTPELTQQLRAAGDGIEQRVVRMASDGELAKAIGKSEGQILSASEKAAGAIKLQEATSAKLAALGEEMAQAGAKTDLQKLVADFRAEKGLVETGKGRDPGGRYLPSSMGPDARKALKETGEWLGDLEKIGPSDIRQLTEASAQLRAGLDTTTPAGQSLALDLRRELASRVEAEVARVQQAAQEKLGPEFAARWANAELDQKAASALVEATAQGAKGAQASFGVEEAGRAALRGLETGSPLGVPLAVGGAYVSYLVKRYGADIAAQMARAVTRGEVVQALDRTMQQVAGEKIAGLVGAGARAVRELPAAAPGLGTEVARAVRREQPADEPRGTLAVRFRAARDEVTSAVDTREARVQAATAGLDDAAPGLSKAVQQVTLAAHDFLLSKLPKIAPRPSLQPHLERPRDPSADEMATYLRYVRAVSDPLSVLDDARRGKLRAESVEALKAVYPTLYGALQAQVMTAVQDRKERLSYNERVRLGLLLDLPTDPSMEPEAWRDYQAIQPQAPSPFAPPGAAQGSPPPRASTPLKAPSLAPRSDQIGA